MNNQVSDWDFLDSTLSSIDNPAAEGSSQSNQTVQNHGVQNQVHSGSGSLCNPPMTWTQIQPLVDETIFRDLSGVELDEFYPVNGNFNLERGESNEHRPSERDVTPLDEKASSQEVKRPKRSRETHNRSEKRRRDRIRGKLKTLQELIPNCPKENKAAMLDEAIHYLKTLKQQVEVMSVEGSILNQPPFKMSPVTQYHQTMQIPQYTPTLPTWLAGMQLSTQNLFPSSSVSNFSPFTALASGFPLLHSQVAFNPLQTPFASTSVPPQLLPNYNPTAVNLPNHVGYTYRGSQNVATNISGEQLSRMHTTRQVGTTTSLGSFRGSQYQPIAFQFQNQGGRLQLKGSFLGSFH